MWRPTTAVFSVGIKHRCDNCVVSMTEDRHYERPDPAGQKRGRFSTKAKALIATAATLVGLATGILTLRNQIFPPAPSLSGVTTSGGQDVVAAISSDAEAKSRANRVSDVLKQCVTTTRQNYEDCSTAGLLGAIHIPIGFGVGQVEVDVNSPATFDLTSRSESGHVFQLRNFATGEQVRSCTPLGAGACPPDGRW